MYRKILKFGVWLLEKTLATTQNKQPDVRGKLGEGDVVVTSER